MTQADLFPPFVAGSDTSEAAAESVAPLSGAVRARVYVFVKGRPDGATCDEVEVALRLRHQTASARVRELARMGMLVDSKKRRPTRSGRAAAVWVAR